MNLIKCMQTNGKWYKNAFRGSRPVGVLWHETGAGNPNLRRYIQPLESDANYAEMIALLGKNHNANDWNHAQVSKGVNAMIGKLADGSIATVQTGDWTMAPWGCYRGPKGSCNGYIMEGDEEVYQGIHWIQFEICDDKYADKAYFEAVFQEACELTAHLCQLYNIDPFGTVKFNGVTVPTIICHQDAYKLGLGNNHGDVYTWFKPMGLPQNMGKVRTSVAAMLAASATPTKEELINKKLDAIGQLCGEIREMISTS